MALKQEAGAEVRGPFQKIGARGTFGRRCRFTVALLLGQLSHQSDTVRFRKKDSGKIHMCGALLTFHLVLEDVGPK